MHLVNIEPLHAPESLVLDPEPIRARYQRLLGRAPYRWWRPLVHAEHFLRVLLALPGRSGLVVHDTGTRGWRRRLLARLADRFGRTGHLLFLDVPARVALEGQRRRRRALGRSAFATHWHSWHELRTALTAPAATEVPGPGDPDPSGLRAEGWRSVRLVDRPAADRLRRVVIPRR